MVLQMLGWDGREWKRLAVQQRVVYISFGKVWFLFQGVTPISLIVELLYSITVSIF